MSAEPKPPKTLLEAIEYFGDRDTARNFFVPIRWPDGIRCPHCGSEKVAFSPKYDHWLCLAKHRKCTFTLKSGTVFAYSVLPLGTWLVAVWLESNANNAITTREFHRAIGLPQKTIWHMLHRVRLALLRMNEAWNAQTIPASRKMMRDVLVTDPHAALRRTQEAIRHILSVPKSATDYKRPRRKPRRTKG